MEGEHPMRSLALTALLGSLIASTCLVGQSLTEHAAAAAGATIGTAAGKPLGTALGRVFGEVEKADAPKTAKPAPAKPVAAVAPVATTEHAPVAAASSGGGRGGEVAAGGGGGAKSAPSHHAPHRTEDP